jgi:hypothetical protein
VVRFTRRPLYPQRKSPRYPLDTRLGRPQSRSGRDGEEKNPIIAPAGNWIPVVQPVAQSLYWPRHPGSGDTREKDFFFNYVMKCLLVPLQSKARKSWWSTYMNDFETSSLRHRVKSGSGAHPISYQMGTGGSFPGGKASGAQSWPLTSIYCRG